MIVPQIIFNPLMPTFTLAPFIKSKLIVGIGCTEKVGTEAKQFTAKKVLLVTDKGVALAGLLNKVENSLEAEEIEFDIFDEVEPEPHIESLELAKDAVRKHKYDMVIGVGGGSTLDTTKAASIIATNPGNVRDYIGENLVKKSPLPMILIPTTAGTGSEISTGVVVTVGEFKNFIIDYKLVPDIAMIDPLMSASMPPRLTANSGADALSHAIEGSTSLSSNPITDALNLQAIKLIADNLKIAYHQGGNLKARYNMAIAATLAGAHKCTLNHAIAQTFSAKFNIPHGLSCAVSLPYTMEFNIPGNEAKYVLIASAMDQDISGVTSEEAARKAVEVVVRLLRELDIPLSLKELDIPRDYLPKLVEDLFMGRSGQKRNIAHNPRIITKENITRTVEKMWEGKIG